MDFGGGDDIRFERIGKAGVVTLTRPKAFLTNKLGHTATDAEVNALLAKVNNWLFALRVGAVVIQKDDGTNNYKDIALRRNPPTYKNDCAGAAQCCATAGGKTATSSDLSCNTAY